MTVSEIVLWAIFVVVQLSFDFFVLYLLYRVLSFVQRRRMVERVVISQIASVLRQNLPLVPGLLAAADSERRSAAIHLRRIALLLDQGTTLSHAIRAGYVDCSTRTLSRIIAGENMNQLPAVVDGLETEMMNQDRGKAKSQLIPYLYGGAVFLMLSYVVIGLLIAVVPKYMEIFLDYKTDLPWATRSLIHVSDWFFRGTPPGIALFVPFVLSLPVVFYWVFRHRRLERLSWISRWMDTLRWNLPGLRSLERSEGLASVAEVLRFGARSGLDLTTAVREAGQLDVNHHLRERMRRAVGELERGETAETAFRKAKVGAVLQAAVASGLRTGDLETPLTFACNYYRAIVSRWWLVIREATLPLLTLAVAIPVAFMAYALFTPMIALLESAIESWGM